ncbi:hypothetical protein TrVFT333_010157 [Trichoderma virens FT-333]|nr:hypothetical protein TrVFT333_010157 [Trichoderma virens FT-333]
MCRLVICHYTVCMCWSRNHYEFCSSARQIKGTDYHKQCSKTTTALRLLIGWCDKCMSTIENHIKSDADYDSNKPAVKFRDATAIRRFWGVQASDYDDPEKVRKIFSRQHDPLTWLWWDPIVDRKSDLPVQPGHITWEGKLIHDAYRAAKASAVLLGPDSYDPRVVDWSEITQRARISTIVWANGYEDGERHAPRVPLYMDKPYDAEMWKLTAPGMSRPVVSYRWWSDIVSRETTQPPPPSYGELYPASGHITEQ